MGVPSNYKPAHMPLIPIPANGGSPSDPMYAYYESNTVWVKLKDGTLQRTSFDTNLNPWRNQFLSGLYNWDQSASLFKVIPVKESGNPEDAQFRQRDHRRSVLGQRSAGVAVRPAAQLIARLARS